jgi:hypothetical protein
LDAFGGGLTIDVGTGEVIGVLGMRKRMRDNQVDSCGWEEETEDSMGVTEVGLRCNGTEVMWHAKMTWKQGEGHKAIGKGVGTRHRWKWCGAKWCRWRKVRRGDATGGMVSGGQVWEDNRDITTYGRIIPRKFSTLQLVSYFF